MDSKRCKTLEACGVATRKEEFDCGTVRRQSNRDKDVAVVSWILEIPLPLLYDILIRISVETFFSCRCVCKIFFNILTDPQFAQDHLRKEVATTDKEALVIHSRNNRREIFLIYNYMCEIEKINIDDHANSHCQTLSRPFSASPIRIGAYHVGSCNGLLCTAYTVYNLSEIHFDVCNPVLGEFSALPPHHIPYYHQPAFGFGFCPKTEQYKVIVFAGSSLCKVHTLGTECWREVSDNIPNPHYSGSDDQSFRGFLHWIVNDFTASKLICSFNLETEQASFLPTPSHFTQDSLPKLSDFQIGKLGGSFCLSYHCDTTLEVCVMKNYGVKESWSKAFSIDFGVNSGLRELFAVSTYKFIEGCLFFSSQSSLVCYNLQKGTKTKFLANNVRYARARLFSPSFISLKDITVGSGGNVEFGKRKMRRNNWYDKDFPIIS